jgi:hypothetical protein
MPLKPGQLDALANFIDPDCMARYIDDALPPIPPLPAGIDVIELLRNRRLFLIALSEGVIEYLKAHDQDSFQVNVAVAGSTGTGAVTIV